MPPALPENRTRDAVLPDIEKPDGWSGKQCGRKKQYSWFEDG